MATTDLHVHIFPYDYYADKPVDMVGLARTGALIDKIRKEAANTLLVDNGDFLQGSPMGDYFAYERGLKWGDTHPIIAAMNALGYDAATLGNHEFNYGLEFLQKALARAEFPVICANALRKAGADPRRDQTLLSPYVILERLIKNGAGESHPIRIGIIGFLPPQITHWDETHLRGSIQSRDILETAYAYIPEIKEAGADIVIALSHSGIGSASAGDGMENASVPLARTAGIDAIVTGHSHLVFPSAQFEGVPEVDLARGTISGKPSVMSGFWGSHLGLIDLMMERDGQSWRVISSRSEARPIAVRNAKGAIEALTKSAPYVLASARKAHKATLDYMRQEVGQTVQPLHSYFALIANSPSLQLVCRAQAWHVQSKLAGTDFAKLPMLSAAAPFKAGGRSGPEHYTVVPKGGLALRNVADLYAFPNVIRAVRVNGSQVADWLERSASIFNQITPTQTDQFLINPDFPSYNFDIITGVTYELDPSQPARYSIAGELANPGSNRVMNLCFAGCPIDPEAEFIVATNNYRISSSPILSDPSLTEIAYNAPITNRDILLQYIAEHRPLRPLNEPNWRLACSPGTSFLFDTSPDAQEHLGDLIGMNIEPVGEGSEGFARFRINA